jgi:hypothetical protein
LSEREKQMLGVDSSVIPLFSEPSAARIASYAFSMYLFRFIESPAR